jgi:hypothetical protein
MHRTADAIAAAVKIPPPHLAARPKSPNKPGIF